MLGRFSHKVHSEVNRSHQCDLLPYSKIAQQGCYFPSLVEMYFVDGGSNGSIFYVGQVSHC
jgi:hypothetical protein